MVICSRTLPPLLYLILLETNTIDHPILTILILSASIGSCFEKKDIGDGCNTLADLHGTRHYLLTILASLQDT